jgi:hypothetical protein
VISRQSTAELGGFEQRLLGELMQMIADPGQVPARQVPARPAAAAGRRAGRVRVALTAGLAAAAVTAVALAVGMAGHGAAGKTQPQRDTATAGGGFPAANQAFYQVVTVGARLPNGVSRQSACQIIWYYTPLTGRYFQSFTEPCSANPGRKFPGAAGRPMGSEHGFPALPTLSDRPVTLFGQLSRAANRGARYWGTGAVGTGSYAVAGFRLTTHAAVMLVLVERLLEMPVPHPLRDALCQVAGRIPGVRAARRVLAITGRHVVTFRLEATRRPVEFVWFAVAAGSREFVELSDVQRTRDGRWYSMTVLRTGLVREN